MAASGQRIVKVSGGQDENGAMLIAARPHAKMSWEYSNVPYDNAWGLNQDC